MAIAQGRTLVGVNTSDNDFKTSEKTGGSKSHTHTLNNAYGEIYIGSTYIYYNRKTVSYTTNIRKDVGGSYYESISDRGGSDLQIGGSTDGSIGFPYYTIYIFKRTA